MTRRRLYFGLVLVAVLCLPGHVALYPTAPRHRIDGKTVTLIQKGMSQADVEAIFGVPPGNYSEFKKDWKAAPILQDGQLKVQWVGDDIHVIVVFGPTGRVVNVGRFAQPVPRTELFFAKIGRWLGM